MIRVMVTGSTGFVGSALSLELAHRGYFVHALYRDINKTKVLNHPDIKLFKGDINNKLSLEAAMKNCDGLFHTAACVKLWAKDPYDFIKINLQGTKNVIDIAKKFKLKRCVFTSTAGVFDSSNKKPISETDTKCVFKSLYEESKSEADKLILESMDKTFKPIIVYPTRIYGPGLLGKSNSIVGMINKYINGKWHFIPGNGKTLGNYVFINDVVKGHILAFEKGKVGNKYILSGSTVSYNDFFGIVKRISNKNYKLYHIPLFVMRALATLMSYNAKITGIEPLVTKAFIAKVLKNWDVSCSKASKELGYNPTPIQKAIEQTINWIYTQESKVALL